MQRWVTHSPSIRCRANKATPPATRKHLGATPKIRTPKSYPHGPSHRARPPQWNPSDRPGADSTHSCTSVQRPIGKPHHLINLITETSPAPHVFDNHSLTFPNPTQPIVGASLPLLLPSSPPKATTNTIFETQTMADQITESSLRDALAQRLQAVHVEVTDMSGTRNHPPPPSHDTKNVIPRRRRRRCRFRDPRNLLPT